MHKLACNILIIGSGAAGSVLAATLSELTNKKIILTEKGGYFKSDFFNQRELDMNVLYANKGNRSTQDGAMVIRGGECVGGGTTVNFALCFDPIQSVWNDWEEKYGLHGFSFDKNASNYGIPGLNMAACLNDVKERLNIHPVADEDINTNNRLFESGCRKLGFRTKKFELNMRDCVGSGYCGEGCAYDAKQSTMITYIDDAMKRNVQLIHHCKIEELIFSNNGSGLSISGAHGKINKSQEGSQQNELKPGEIIIQADIVIVCAGAIETPALLQRSEHPDPHETIGRGLIVHPSLPIIGQMNHKLVNYRGIAGAIHSDHFYENMGFYFECLFGHPVYGSVIIPNFGVDHFEWMLKYQQICGFGVMLIDSVDLDNRVVWDKTNGRTNIYYRLGLVDKKRLRFAAEKAVEIMFAAGAREVLLPSEEPLGSLSSPHFRKVDQARYCRNLQFLPHQTTLTSAHCQGTAKMGENQQQSVTNSRGESHHVKNLLLCDASSFPTSCGANPMVSIMAMARYQGKRIAGEIERYEN